MKLTKVWLSLFYLSAFVFYNIFDSLLLLLHASSAASDPCTPLLSHVTTFAHTPSPCGHLRKHCYNTYSCSPTVIRSLSPWTSVLHEAFRVELCQLWLQTLQRSTSPILPTSRASASVDSRLLSSRSLEIPTPEFPTPWIPDPLSSRLFGFPTPWVLDLLGPRLPRALTFRALPPPGLLSPL